MAELDLGGSTSKLSYFSDYHPSDFCCFFLSRVAGEERPEHVASSLQENTDRQTTIQAHIHNYSQFRVTTSSLPQVHVFGLREEGGVPRENPCWQGEKT